MYCANGSNGGTVHNLFSVLVVCQPLKLHFTFFDSRFAYADIFLLIGTRLVFGILVVHACC